ncbi:hypothetical protein ACJQWK_05458 [Exserohilum turcicum]
MSVHKRKHILASACHTGNVCPSLKRVASQVQFITFQTSSIARPFLCQAPPRSQSSIQIIRDASQFIFSPLRLRHPPDDCPTCSVFATGKCLWQSLVSFLQYS